MGERRVCRKNRRISWILVVDRHWNIGWQGKLLFHLPEDLRRFKEITMGHVLLMGRKTFESLPGILPGRLHLVLSRDRAYRPHGVEVVHSREEAMAWIERCSEEKKIFMAGGGEIARLFLEDTKEALITEVDAVAQEADASLPRLEAEGFYRQSTSSWMWQGDLRYRYQYYLRKEEENGL